MDGSRLQPIDIGDFVLDKAKPSRQSAIFHGVRERIIEGLWPKGGKLPSTRKFASDLGVSRNTVILAYEQLVAEGYITSVKGSGYYVSVDLPEHYLAQVPSQPREPYAPTVEPNINKAFAPGVPDLSLFPYAKWQRLLQRHVSRDVIAGNRSVQGDSNLRHAISDYLSSSRSVVCTPSRIIITSGAQQAMIIALMSVLKPSDKVLMENPGYAQMRKSLNLLNMELEPLSVQEKSGPSLADITSSQAQALYLTPSNQYPMGTTLNTEQRLKIIEWAHQNKRWVIEDDYDSEFQFAHRPYTSMQGLAGKIGHDDRVLYVGSFSKVMFNGLRLGYLVVPEDLVPRCLEIKDALSGDSPSHTQAALADFILEGDLLRHIRKMRRTYKMKYHAMIEAIERTFDGRVQVISQPAGLHVTVKWEEGIREELWCERALDLGIIIRPLAYYENRKGDRSWHGAVLGFGNVPVEDIDRLINKLATVF